MTKHDWKELYILEDDPRGGGNLHPVPVDVDRCSNCRVLRVKKHVNFMPFIYFDPKTWGRSTTNSPVCEEGSDG